MKMKEQKYINDLVLDAIEKSCSNSSDLEVVGRLRTCKAYVLEDNDYYYLKSYNTLISVIEKSTSKLFDFLRLAYGYTPTSAQHIAKFAKDYHAKERFTWRNT